MRDVWNELSVNWTKRNPHHTLNSNLLRTSISNYDFFGNVEG